MKTYKAEYDREENVILEQTSLYVDNQTFQKILDWMETPATQEQIEGLNRLAAIKTFGEKKMKIRCMTEYDKLP